MKKLRVFLLVLALCLLTGCSARDDEDDDDRQSSSRRKLEKKQEQLADDDDDDDDDKDSDKGKDSDKDQSDKKDPDQSAPTAEELVNGIKGMFDDKSGYANVTLKLSLEAEVDASSMGLGDSKLPLKMTVAANAETDGENQHMDGDAYIDMFGMMQLDEKMESYKIANGDMYQVYEYSSDSDSWTTYTEYKDDDDDGVTQGVTEFTADTFDDLQMKEDGKNYVVTGKMPYDKLAGSSDLMDGVGGLGADDALKDAYFDVTMVFEKDSRVLKELTFVVKGMNADDMEIKDFSIVMSVNEYGGSKKISVPDEVVSMAGVSAGSSDYDDLDSGFSFGGSDEQKDPLDIRSTGKYDAKSFKEEMSVLLGLDEDDWYVYNSDRDGYRYTSISASVYDYTKGWSLYLDFSVYDENNDDYFTAESNFEGMGGDYYKEYLENYVADGNAVKGESKKDHTLWYVDGGGYDTYYIGLDGNTVLKINGYVSNFSGEATKEKFDEMMDSLKSTVKAAGFPG